MLKRNIPKICASVICFGAICLFFSACLSISSNGSKANDNRNNSGAQKSADYREPKVVGTIDSKEISESSGLANSPCQPDVLWTHNDSGNDPLIFALDKTGKKLATFRVSGAKNTDWEDIAIRRETSGAGECFLYIGEIGNNARARGEFIIYKVREPQVTGATDSSKKNPLSTEAAEAIKFDYPDFRHDAETLMVHPATGDIYVLSKRMSGASAVYKLKAGADSGKTNTLEKITDFTVPAIPNGLLTGGSISPDGTRVVVCDYFAAYEMVLPKQAKNFDEIWKQKPQKIELGKRAQGEAVAYAADGKAIYATSEEKDSPLIEVRRK
ncbi:MAG: hypothetical protein M3384_14695 [Acidobacteriota bacterium]|nr:hypothetical protein [Acidobacteriota bacterium]